MYQPIITPRDFITGLATLLLTAGLGACGQESNSSAGGQSQDKAVPAQPVSATQSQATVQRDLKTFDICRRVAAADVAGILDSTPDRVSAKATMTTYATDCTYTVERGDDGTDYAILFLYSPQMWAPAMAGKIEKIEGLGDDAYLELESLGSFKNVKVLVEGDFMLDARGNSPEQARALAVLGLERLTGDGG